jgi:signal transduction histidine kinase
MVQHIVSAHGGEVHVASQPGAGSAFTIRLPVSP